MSSNDNKPTEPQNTLLDELESIKGLLDDSVEDDDELSIDIPILEDVVSANPATDSPSLLDLEHIFDDEPDDRPAAGIDQLLDSDELDLEDLDLDDMDLSELGLGGLDLDNLDTDIEIPRFKLQTETTESTVPSVAEQAPELPLADDLFDAVLDDGDELWLADDPIADSTAPRHQDPADPVDAPQATTVADTGAAEDEELPSLQFIIQDIVDELIPQIEDELRKRLSQCSPAVIQQLAAQHLDD